MCIRDSSQLHNDSTTVTVTGNYPAADGRARGGTAIRHGHNKDYRPDLKQLLFIRTVGGDGADEQQLLEVGTVVLVVTVADRRGRRAAPGPPVGRRVVAGHGDGGRVVVQLGDVDAEVADDSEHL